MLVFASWETTLFWDVTFAAKWWKNTESDRSWCSVTVKRAGIPFQRHKSWFSTLLSTSELSFTELAKAKWALITGDVHPLAHMLSLDSIRPTTQPPPIHLQCLLANSHQELTGICGVHCMYPSSSYHSPDLFSPYCTALLTVCHVNVVLYHARSANATS